MGMHIILYRRCYRSTTFWSRPTVFLSSRYIKVFMIKNKNYDCLTIYVCLCFNRIKRRRFYTFKLEEKKNCLLLTLVTIIRVYNRYVASVQLLYYEYIYLYSLAFKVISRSRRLDLRAVNNLTAYNNTNNNYYYYLNRCALHIMLYYIAVMLPPISLRVGILCNEPNF